MIEATGWAPHTVRGFLAGLNKKGHRVTVLERVRQVGAGKEGAKGCYSIYRIADVGLRPPRHSAALRWSTWRRRGGAAYWAHVLMRVGGHWLRKPRDAS